LEEHDKKDHDANNKKNFVKSSTLGSVRNLMAGNNHEGSTLRPTRFLGTKPIAELFPETTVMFADIVGFTAWCSVREPAQVFTLLETIYNAFDHIAKRTLHNEMGANGCPSASVMCPVCVFTHTGLF
jgi:hypothetical protein